VLLSPTVSLTNNANVSNPFVHFFDNQKIGPASGHKIFYCTVYYTSSPSSNMNLEKCVRNIKKLPNLII